MTRHLNSSGSSSSSGISLASSASSSSGVVDDGISTSRLIPSTTNSILRSTTIRSPAAVSSGYNSSQETSPTSQQPPQQHSRVYSNQPQMISQQQRVNLIATAPSNRSSQKSIESLKRLQELELVRFKQKQAMLRLQSSDSDEYNTNPNYGGDYSVFTNRNYSNKKPANNNQNNIDSGISMTASATTNTAPHRHVDVESTASDATSNLSTYMSSSPLFSSSSSSASSHAASQSSSGANSANSLVEWSPFPKVGQFKLKKLNLETIRLIF